MRVVLVPVFTLWLATEGTVSVNTFESVPPAVNGVLTACPGQQISLTCSRDQAENTDSLWVASDPLNCMTAISHSVRSANPPCDPFTFEDITEIDFGVSLLNYTAVAIANVNMTGADIECRRGTRISSVGVANISLCVVDQLLAPSILTCGNSTNGLKISWEAVNDTTCAMSDVGYLVTAVKAIDMITIISSVPVAETRIELTNTQGLERNTTYIIYVQPRTLIGSCTGRRASVVCKTSASLPTVTTQPPVVPTTELSQSPAPSSDSSPASLPTGAVVGIAMVGVVIAVFGFVTVTVVVIFIKKCYRDGKNGGVHAPLAADSDQQQLPVYAMVDKSKVAVEQPTYQDPASIQHETAPTGDVYAVTDKKPKKGPTGAELAQMYSIPDKSKGTGLTYASLDMPDGGGGSEASKRPAPTEYSTVIN